MEAREPEKWMRDDESFKKKHKSSSTQNLPRHDMISSLKSKLQLWVAH